MEKLDTVALDDLSNVSSVHTPKTGERPGFDKKYYDNRSFNFTDTKSKDCCSTNCFGISRYIWSLGRLCYGHIFFWMCVTGLCLIEPILVAREPVGTNLKFQKMVLGISTFLWILQIIGELDYYWKSDIYRHIKHKEHENWYNLACVQQSFLYLFHRPEYVLDSVLTTNTNTNILHSTTTSATFY